MSKSQIIFQRWKHVQSHSWPFQVYKLYNEELSGFIWSIEATSKYTYQMLEKNGAKWEDLPTKHFAIPNHRIWAMKDMKGWSDKFNESKNWIRLNAVMAISSNLETYLSSITALAIESNPGVLLGAPPRLIDGAKLVHWMTQYMKVMLRNVQRENGLHDLQNLSVCSELHRIRIGMV